MEVGLVLGGVVLIGRVGRYGDVRTVLTVVDIRDGKYSMMSV